MQHELTGRLVALKAYVDMVSSSHAPEDLKSYLFRFGTVLMCGTIERCVEIIVLNRLAHKAHPRILRFVKSHFKKGTNFDCRAVKQLLERFDPAWADKWSEYVNGSPDVDERINSLYAVRNSVAHGGSQSIGSARLKELYQITEQYVDAMVDSTA